MTAKNMTLKEMKNKILENFFIDDGEKTVKNFDDLCHYTNITYYKYGIKNFPKLKWQHNLEKYYNVVIPKMYLIHYDIAMQSDENYEEKILENNDDKLVISYQDYGGDGQSTVDFDVTIYADGHLEYNLGEFKNDRRDYTNYINEIEGIAKHLHYDVKKLTGDQLGYIIENYIDSLLYYLRDTMYENFENFVLEYKLDQYSDDELEKYMALPLELKKKLFEKIG